MTALRTLGLLIALSATAWGQTIPRWLRYPAISPDGKTIAFSYKGDIYRVDSDGGVAVPLTLYEGHDTRPIWSHDGQWLAFASDRHGNFDIFVMPASGGEAQRLTYHSADDYPSDFSVDNGRVLFSSTRLDHVNNSQFPSGGLSELYEVSVTGGMPRQIVTFAAEWARYDKDGRRIVFQDAKGYENEWRKHHTSSVTRDIVVYDTEDETYDRVANFEGEDRFPVFSQDGQSVFYLSEAAGTFNLFHADLANAEEPSQLTQFEFHPVRFLSIADDDRLCFTYDGDIYTMLPDGQPAKLALQIYTTRHTAPELEQVSDGATEMAVSPNGKEVAFIVRGEVFVTSVETSTTKQVTETPEQERSVSFHPDGRRLLYAAERDGSWNLYQTKIKRDEELYFFEATLLEEEPLLISDDDTFEPRFSPDGKEVAFLHERTSLRVLNLASKAVRTILSGENNVSYGDGDQHFAWAPDGRWFVSHYLQPGFWFNEVALVPSDGKGSVFNVTRSGYSDNQPKWFMEGKMIAWASNREGLRSYAGGGSTQYDIFATFATQAAYDRFNLSKEELEVLKEKEAKEKEAKEKEAEKKDEDDDKEDKKKKDDKDELKPLDMELDGLDERIVKLTIHSTNLSDFVVTPDGENLLYMANVDKGYDLWQTELRTKETKVLAKMGGGPGSLVLDAEGKHVFVLSRGRIAKVEIASGKRSGVGFSEDMVLDRAGERAYIFEHCYRQVKDKFYDPELHGTDWDFYAETYRKFLPHINNNYDFADLLSELLGELNASHTGGRYRPPSKPGDDDSAFLGLFYDQAYQGDGMKVAEVMPENPLIKDGSKLKAGVIIEKIDGQALTAGTNLHKLLNNKADKRTLLSLFDPASETRWEERVKPLSGGQQYRLLYNRWVESRRNAVEALSDGKVGYVHVRNMSDSSYRTVIDEVIGREADAKALVVDTRFNGGGDLVDDLSTWLSGKAYMDFVPPDGRVIGQESQRRWLRPSIVLMGEGNYSDAHCFPWAYKTLEIGKLVGMPVPGTCTFVWWERQIDPSVVFGIPNIGVRGPDGVMLENSQLEPDIRVENTYKAMAKGEDPQLKRAVEELLQQVQ